MYLLSTYYLSSTAMGTEGEANETLLRTWPLKKLSLDTKRRYM